MSRQEKSITERHAKILRDLVKQSANKVCADCKRNDPRWASWNLGVFLCIRCSGIHRSMGTHISKIKSIDLDIWTPEQMESIQNWGNARANSYWEAHLKAGHVPADHKMESFIRSKYESRRWALEGPPPKDPSVLEDDLSRQDASSPPPPPPPLESQKLPAVLPAPPTSTTISTQAAQRQTTTTARPLLSSQRRSLPAAPLSPPPSSKQTQQQQGQQPANSPQNDLFSLDFHNPSPINSQSQAMSSQGNTQRNVKDDILSLFSAPPTGTGVLGGGGFANVNTSPAATSMVGNAGTGMWGAQSGWNGAPPTQSPPSYSANIWSQPQANAWSQTMVSQQQSQQPFGALGNAPSASITSFGTQDIWGSTTPHQQAAIGGQTNDLFSSTFSAPAQQKKDDAFGDIWGSFK